MMTTTQSETKKDIINKQEIIEQAETSTSLENKDQTIKEIKESTSTSLTKKSSSGDHQSKKMKKEQYSFFKKLITIPIIKESLTNTQTYMIRFPLGKQVYDQTNSMMKVIKKQMKKTKQSTTFTYYFPKDGTIRQSIQYIDGLASQSLDKVTTHVPLLQQPTQKIISTFIVQPQDFVMIQWKRTKHLPSFIKKNMDYLLKLPALTQLESEYHKNIEPITTSVKSQWKKSNARFF